MKKIYFAKMEASGNDFVVINTKLSGKLSSVVRYLCDRKSGIGADGVLLLGKSKKADIKMRVLNADGSEAEMCGNGARCVSLYLGKASASLETKAGIIESRINADSVKIKLTEPKNIKLDMPVKLRGKVLKVNFIDTGVPHAVVFVEGLDKIDAAVLGRDIRYHKVFSPGGTNVDFVEVINNDSIKVRTYERGVEDETLACGTGSVAAALIFALKSGACRKINVHTKGKDVLSVYFNKHSGKFRDVWLEGRVRTVFVGEFIF